MPNGMMMMVKVGVAMMITIKVLRTRNEVKRKERIDLGMTSSIV